MNELVYDIGMHTGVDTAHYLSKGYRVVAIEANPSLVTSATVRFAAEIAIGRLAIEGIGIHEKEGQLEFIVNDQVDEWSSFVPHLGSRAGSYHSIKV